MVRQILGVFLFFALTGYASSALAQTKFQIEKIDDTTLRIIGNFDKKTSAQLLAELRNEPEIDHLVITSGGGDVDASLDVARLIHERNIAIEVVDLCMSSCFNYFLLSASEIHVRPGAVIMFHGSAGTTPIPFWARPFSGRYIKRVRTEEAEFLQLVGQSENLFDSFFEEIKQYSEDQNIQPFPWMVGSAFFAHHNFSFPNRKLSLMKRSLQSGSGTKGSKRSQ